MTKQFMNASLDQLVKVFPEVMGTLNRHPNLKVLIQTGNELDRFARENPQGLAGIAKRGFGGFRGKKQSGPDPAAKAVETLQRNLALLSGKEDAIRGELHSVADPEMRTELLDLARGAIERIEAIDDLFPGDALKGTNVKIQGEHLSENLDRAISDVPRNDQRLSAEAVNSTLEVHGLDALDITD